MKNKIFNENNLLTMDRMLDNSVDGIITSPPYNVAIKRKDGYYNNGYSEIDNLSEEEYLNIRLNEFKKFERILKKDGVICYNISYTTDNPILPIFLLNKIHNETNLTLTEIITWEKKVSLPFQGSPNKLSRICESIYIIVNKDYLRIFKANKEISKINEKTGQSFYKDYKNLIKASNNDGYKCNHKASFSQDLVNQLLNIYFPVNSIIYDPFMGIGTTALSCVKNNRYFIGSELNKDFYKISIDRLNKLL